ncbi:MAG: hypothetical protein HQL52_15105 [Magnetococcales bacterium]|nr:hypothetical protein [Magnetococcales bacterium]
MPLNQTNAIPVKVRSKFAHPVEYWWHKDPSYTGDWDYYTPVVDSSLPIPVTTIEEVEVDIKPGPGVNPVALGLQMWKGWIGTAIGMVANNR